MHIFNSQKQQNKCYGNLKNILRLKIIIKYYPSVYTNSESESCFYQHLLSLKWYSNINPENDFME